MSSQYSNKPKIGIAGAGIMGSSIAQRFKQFHFDVVIFDVNADSITNSRANNRINQQALVDAGLIDIDDSQRILATLHYSDSMNCLTDCDIIIEAISEKIEVKSAFYEQLNHYVKSTCVIVSNTSAIPISQLAKYIDNPERFAGMHWINPPHLIRVIEIIRGKKTTDATIATIKNLTLAIDKTPIVLQKDIKGFAFNRLQFALLREALHLVDNGVVSIEDIDQMVKQGLGLRWTCCGPFETADFGGIDTFNHISKFLNPDLANDSEGSKTLEKMVELEQLGVKSQQGFYNYSNGKDAIAIAKRDELLLQLNLLIATNDKPSN